MTKHVQYTPNAHTEQHTLSHTGDSRWLELRPLEVLDLSKQSPTPKFVPK